MPAPRDPQQLMRAAELYYLEHRSQAQVATELGTSRSNVSRMLAEAQRQGLVEIRIKDPSGRDRALERDLVAHWGLSSARVAARGGEGARGTDERVGRQAADLLVEAVTDGVTIGVSWGRALQATVDAVPDALDRHGLTVVQLLGGVAQSSNEISGQELVRELARRLEADYRLLHAPATLGSAAAARSLLSETSVASALDAARGAGVALVGVGDPRSGSSEAVMGSLRLTDDEQRDFWAQEPVGDLAGRYYRADGSPVTGAVDERVVAVTLDDLARIPHVIGVAVGRVKVAAVLGALRGRRLDSLVCDESLARGLLGRAPG